MKSHIAVCICTYKRPRLLKRLLEALAGQETRGEFTFSVVVADNDPLFSAKQSVQEFASASPVRVVYCVEPRQNIALARNRALLNAEGDFIAFIDDDEFPIKLWLHELFSARRKYSADGVMGPVMPVYEQPPPQWIIKGKFHERLSWPDGHTITWRNGKTGNLLFAKEILDPREDAFRPEFLTGEDQDFFRRMTQKNRRFVWCNGAVAYEVVSPGRWRRSFMLRRALLRGKVDICHPTFGPRALLRSLIAVPVYSLALPFAFFGGQHWFMKYLIRLCDHLGKLLAFVHLNPIGEKYVSE